MARVTPDGECHHRPGDLVHRRPRASPQGGPPGEERRLAARPLLLTPTPGKPVSRPAPGGGGRRRPGRCGPGRRRRPTVRPRGRTAPGSDPTSPSHEVRCHADRDRRLVSAPAALPRVTSARRLPSTAAGCPSRPLAPGSAVGYRGEVRIRRPGGRLRRSGPGARGRGSTGPSPTVAPDVAATQAAVHRPRRKAAASNEVLAAYRTMWADLVTAAATSDYQSPLLAQHATGDALTLFVQGLARDHLHDIVTRGHAGPSIPGHLALAGGATRPTPPSPTASTTPVGSSTTPRDGPRTIPVAVGHHGRPGEDGRDLEGEPDHHRGSRHLLITDTPGSGRCLHRILAGGLHRPPSPGSESLAASRRAMMWTSMAAARPVARSSGRWTLLPSAPGPRPAARADHDLGDVPLPGEVDDRLGRVVAVDLVPFGADVGGHLAQGDQPIVGDRPSSPGRQTWRTWRSALIRAAIRDARRTMASVPGAVVTPTRMRSLVSHTTSLRWCRRYSRSCSSVSSARKRRASSRSAVRLSVAEVVGQRLGDLLGRVDVAVEHPAPELLGRRVDQLDLVGLSDHPVGTRSRMGTR